MRPRTDTRLLSTSLFVAITVAIILMVMSLILADLPQDILSATSTSPLSSLRTRTSSSAPPLIFLTVAKEDTPCYFGINEGYDALVLIPQFSIVSVLGKDLSGEWMLLKLEGFTDCWIRSTSVQLQGDGNLPLITTLLPPLITPVPSTAVATTQLANQTPYPPIGLTWKILSFDCNNGKVTRAQVDLNVSGGVPPYSYSQELPIYARPEQVVSISVNSSTLDGEPSGTISFLIPRASDFKCDREGNNQVPPPPISSPSNPTDSPNPPPACSDGKDNDSDGYEDYPNDPQCDSPDDTHEGLSVSPTTTPLMNVTRSSTLPTSKPSTPTTATNLNECNDGIDNDSDAFVDENDPNCSSPAHNSESSVLLPNNTGAFSIGLIALGIIIAVLVILGIYRFLNSTLPIPHNVAFIGFPKSGKTTIITSLFGEIFARKTIYKNFQASLIGQLTIDRVNKDLARLERGLTLGPTGDQNIFAYRTKITLTKNFITRTYKVEFGDFPGEQTKDFIDDQPDLIQSEEFFKWVLGADAIVFVVDLGVYLDPAKQKKYVAEMSASIRSAWQKILDAHEDGEVAARKMPITIAFSKLDLVERIEKYKSKDKIKNLVASLGYGEEVPDVIVLDPATLKRFEDKAEKDFSNLIKFLRNEARHFAVVHTGCFGIVDDNRLGLYDLLKAVLPK